MATSQNGYTVYTSSKDLDKTELGDTGVTFPGGTRKDDTGYVLRWVAGQIHKRVEKLKPGWCWGYAYRPIRGQSSGYSNHASATALDLNAPIHPLGKRDTFTSAQRAEIRKILAEAGGVVRWGGDYQNRADDMHFEIDAPYVEVQKVAAKLRAPKPVAKPVSLWGKAAASTVKEGDRTLAKWAVGNDVKRLQYILNRWYGHLKLDEDGYYGADTVEAVKYLQGRAGLPVTGVVDARTWRALNVK